MTIDQAFWINWLRERLVKSPRLHILKRANRDGQSAMHVYWMDTDTGEGVDIASQMAWALNPNGDPQSYRVIRMPDPFEHAILLMPELTGFGVALTKALRMPQDVIRIQIFSLGYIA